MPDGCCLKIRMRGDVMEDSPVEFGVARRWGLLFSAERVREDAEGVAKIRSLRKQFEGRRQLY